MEINPSRPELQYFTGEYIDIINAGGTFTRPELVEFYKSQETKLRIKELLKEISQFEPLIDQEDWEISKSDYEYISKYGKSRFKKILATLKQGLE